MIRFIRSWSNGPLVVRCDTNHLLRAEELATEGDGTFVAWNMRPKSIVRYDPATGRYNAPEADLALQGECSVATTSIMPTRQRQPAPMH
jgi:hypothetical protein